MLSHPRIAYLLPLLAACGALACQNDGDENPSLGACPASLVAGDVVITEVMANPPGADEGNEWIELYNARGEAIDLFGTVLVTSKTDGSSEKLHEFGELMLESEAYAALGDVIDDDALRPEHIAYGYGRGLGSLTNQGGRIALYCGDTLVDEVLYQDLSDGIARAYDGSRVPDATGNDDLMAWCDARSAFAEDALGTPGSANDPCMSMVSPTACSEDGATRDLEPPRPGDLVISEYHPNPSAVTDSDGEFFELYVARDVDLNGLVVGDADSETTLTDERCLRATAGSYLVFARTLDPEQNGGLEPDFEFDFSLVNSDGVLRVVHGEQVLDEIAYASTHDGAASSLDPSLLDPEDNDREDAFCPATESYGAGDLGTPGRANSACESTPQPGQCEDEGELRAPRPPQPGDLVITELMPNPSAVADADGEWFELLVTASVDLNGLELGVEDVDQTLEATACLAVSEGQRLVFARSDDPATNGGLPSVDHVLSFSLRNSSGRLFVAMGGEVLDAVRWPSSYDGAARSLDPEASTPAGNDDHAVWCAATEPYGAGDRGTPGAENPSCGGDVTPEGTCTDGDQTRAIVAPEPGDLVITEFMANPDAVSDSDGEWFEVLVQADVDLNGLALGRDVGEVETTLPSGGDCLAATAGERLVFARSSDSAQNGGLDNVFATFSFSLVNSNRGIFIALDDTVLDAIEYESTSTGASQALDPDAETPEGNDDPSAFCAGTTPYGAGDLGTPGADNPSCG